MRRAGICLLLCISGLFNALTVQAQSNDVLIEVALDRKQGNAPVSIRAILTRPPRPVDTALLYFRGGHGIAKIASLEDKRPNLPLFIGPRTRDFFEAGIALVVMDCPTDQWGATNLGNQSTSCLDDYRSSTRHADDVRAIMARLREDHGLNKLYVMGHSKGTLSSRWLAVHLGNEISGSIHSGSLGGPDIWGNGASLRRIKYDSIVAPILHVHNADDACAVTPYRTVRGYAGGNLLTVRGGIPQGDPCGSGHYHSFQGREEILAKAIITWITTGKAPPVVGE